MPNKHTALLPDGTIAKRTSQNRTYPYVIAVRESYEHALEMAKRYGSYDTHRSNWAYAREQVEQGDAHRHAAYNTPAKQAENERVAALTLEEYRAELTAEAIAMGRGEQGQRDVRPVGRPDVGQPDRPRQQGPPAGSEQAHVGRGPHDRDHDRLNPPGAATPPPQPLKETTT
jgi:hypothetical protein